MNEPGNGKKWAGKVYSRDLVITASRSSGAGGQHVNKTSTKIEVRFFIGAAECLSDREKNALRKWLRHERPSLYSEEQDTVIVTDSASRSQHLNREEAIEKLNALVAKALRPPIRRIKTRIPRSSKKRRAESKRHRSAIKTGRSRPQGE